jgi:uncharacterized protein YqeY
MSLKEQLTNDLKDAMRQRDNLRRDVLRFTLAALHNAEIAARKELSDGEELGVLVKEAKSRRESIEEFRKAARQDLVDKEEAELAILQPYLPQQLSRDEIASTVRDIIAQAGANGPKDFPKVMPVAMQQLKGRADGREVNEVVKELLGGS